MVAGHKHQTLNAQSIKMIKLKKPIFMWTDGQVSVCRQFVVGSIRGAISRKGHLIADGLGRPASE